MRRKNRLVDGRGLPVPGQSKAEQRYRFHMAATSTIKVEFNRELLERLRRRHPDTGDRELLESAVRIQLGREASDRARERFAGVSSKEIEREAVTAVREVREARAARRHTGR